MIKVSESLNGAIENFLELTPQINEHMEKNNNPHAVTKTQIGLANVVNEKQATAQQYIGHIQGEDKHRAEDIMYDDVSLKEKIESISGQFSGETEQELAEVKEDVALIKNELEKGSIFLKGEVVTNTFDAQTPLYLEGDERFVCEGKFKMPFGSTAEVNATVTVVEKSQGGICFAKIYHFHGGAMDFERSNVLLLENTDCTVMPESGMQQPYNNVGFVWENEGFVIYVIGDDRPLYWKAVMEIKNLECNW